MTMKKNVYEFIIHFGVNGGMQFDEVSAYNGGQAQTIMKARYPNAQVSLRSVREGEGDDD